MNAMKRYALFRCCVTNLHLDGFERATDAVLQGLALNMVPVPQFSCCGYPLRNVDPTAWLLAAGRNLALAEAHDTDLVTVCNCCYGTLKHCAWLLRQDAALQAEVNAALGREGLHYAGRVAVRHLFEVLAGEVGVQALRGAVRKEAQGLDLAVHYGCRMLRPSLVLGLDNPFHPSLLDTLVEVLGARSLTWGRKTDCCGAPVLTTDLSVSNARAASKMAAAKVAGADAVCIACPFCLARLERVEGGLPVVSYQELLARGLGLPLPESTAALAL